MCALLWNARVIRRARLSCRAASGALSQLQGAGPETVRTWVLAALVSGHGDSLLPLLVRMGVPGKPWLPLADKCRGVSGLADVLRAATPDGVTSWCVDREAFAHVSTDATRVGGLGLMPDLRGLEIGPCPNLVELPQLPGRCRALVIHDCPNLRVIDVAPPRGLVMLEISRCMRLSVVPGRFLDRASVSYIVDDNDALREIGPFRQRRPRGGRPEALLQITDNAMLRRLPDGFASRMRVDVAAIETNPRLEALPRRFGWRGRIKRLEVVGNSVLTSIERGFLQDASCIRVKITRNPMLARLPAAPRFRVEGKMTLSNSDRLEQLPHGLGGTDCRIGHLKVSTNTCMRVLWTEAAVFYGLLEVVHNFALTSLAPELRFGCRGGLLVNNNMVLRTLSARILGRPSGPFEVESNALLADIAPDGVQLGTSVESVKITNNPSLRRLPRGLLHDQRVTGDVTVECNDSLRSLGHYAGVNLHVDRRLLIRGNARLEVVSLGMGLSVGCVVEVTCNSQMQTMRLSSGTRVAGTITVQGNARLRRLALGTGACSPAVAGGIWIAENPRLEVGLSESGRLQTTGLAFVGNPRLRCVGGPALELVGSVGTLTITDNPSMRSVPLSLLRAADGLVLSRNRILQSLPSGWTGAGRVLSGALRVLHNPALCRLEHVDLDLRAHSIEICNNACLEELAPGSVRLFSNENIEVTDNAALVRAGGGAVQMTASFDLTIARNGLLFELGGASVHAVAGCDLSLECCPLLKRLASDGATLAAGDNLLLHGAGKYNDVSMIADDRQVDVAISLVDGPGGQHLISVQNEL